MAAGHLSESALLHSKSSDYLYLYENWLQNDLSTWNFG